MKQRHGIEIGDNRTGTALAPERTAEMTRGTDEFPPTSEGGAAELTALAVREIADAPSLGSLPAPEKGARLDPQQEPHLVLLDKLGERLAFERTGTRLYEAVLAKVEARGSFDGGPTREELEEIRAEERSHFELLRDTIDELGGDPTTVTPAADVAGVASMGVGKVLGDPRTSLPQCLDALLTTELTDGAAWEMLVELAHAAGQDALVPRFEKAAAREEEHLASVKRWLRAAGGLA